MDSNLLFQIAQNDMKIKDSVYLYYAIMKRSLTIVMNLISNNCITVDSCYCLALFSCLSIFVLK